MSDLLSKDHYSYKIQTLLMKSSAYPPFYRQPSIWTTPTPHPAPSTLPHFYDKISIPLLWFFKNLNPHIKKWGLTLCWHKHKYKVKDDLKHIF